MTQFRTKGKGENRKVYPVGKGNPYGEPRDRALREVISLRERGERARLIETNKRLSLYAPYESTLKQEPNEIDKTKKEVAPVNETATNTEHHTTEQIPSKSVIDDMNDLLTDVSRAKDRATWAPMIESKDGVTTEGWMDPSTVMMIIRAREGTLTDGEKNGIIDALGWSHKERSLKIPDLDYSKDGAFQQIDPNEFKEISTSISKFMEENNSKLGDVVLKFTTKDNVFTVSASTKRAFKEASADRKILDRMVQEHAGGPMDRKVAVSADYFMNAAKGIGARKTGFGISIKNDYPVTLTNLFPLHRTDMESMGRLAADSQPNSALIALIAPRSER